MLLNPTETTLSRLDLTGTVALEHQPIQGVPHWLEEQGI
jgi:hypothetical protein